MSPDPRDVPGSGQVSDGGASIQCATDLERGVLRVAYRGAVTPSMMRDHLVAMDLARTKLPPGFVVVTDLSDLESMDRRCCSDLVRVMEKHVERGVSAVVRIIPDPTRDIGFSILSLFHYPAGIRIFTCATAAEAEELIENLEGERLGSSG